MSIVDFVIDTICLAFSTDRPEWLFLPMLGIFKQIGRAISGAVGGVGRAIGSIFGGGQPTVSVVGGGGNSAANEQALKALQAQLAEQQAAAAKAQEALRRQAAIEADDKAAAAAQNASVERASDRLTSLNAAQLVADTETGQKYALANTGLGNVGGGFDINAARLQALSNVGGAGGGALASATPYLAPSNVAPAVVAAANLEAGGRNVRSNRFNIPAQNLTYGGV